MADYDDAAIDEREETAAAALDSAKKTTPMAEAGVPYDKPEAPAAGVEDRGANAMDDFVKYERERAQRMDAQHEKMMTQYKESQQRSEQIQKQMMDAEAPILDAMAKKAQEPTPQAPQLQQVPPAPDPQKMRQEFMADVDGWMTAGVAIAMIGAARSQTAAITGLSALNGLFTGLREGREDRVNAEFAKWKAASETIVKTNNAMVSEYKQTLQNKKLDFDQQVNSLKLVAAKYQAQLDYEALQRNNLVDWDKLAQAHELHAERVQEAIQKAEQWKAKADLAREKAKQQQISQATGLFTDEQANARAQRWLAGDKTAFQYMGGWKVRNENLTKVEQAVEDLLKARNMTQEEAVAKRRDLDALSTGLRRSYTAEANFGLALNDIKLAVPPAKEAIDKYWGSTEGKGLATLVWNKVTNVYETQQQNPDLAELAVRLNPVIMSYATFSVRTGQTTNQAREEAHSLLNQQFSPEAAKRVLDTMSNEADLLIQSPGMTRQQMIERAGGKKAPPPTPPPPLPPSGPGWKIEKMEPMP